MSFCYMCLCDINLFVEDYIYDDINQIFCHKKCCPAYYPHKRMAPLCVRCIMKTAASLINCGS